MSRLHIVIVVLVAVLSGVTTTVGQTLAYEFNGLRYVFPASQSASTVLSNNGSGILSWGADVPAGMATYMTGACPAGWTEVVAAQGRYVVARASGGGLGSTVGTALTNAQNKTHTHSITAGGAHDHNGVTDFSNNNFREANGPGGLNWIPRDSHGHSITASSNHDHTGVTGSSDTASTSPYIQYPFCSKD